MNNIDYHKPTRAQWWDYRNAGAYFVTINTDNMKSYFGTVTENQMFLSASGSIAKFKWIGIPRHVKHVELGNFVVMPNHIHGILYIMDDAVDVSEDDSARHVGLDDSARHALQLQILGKTPGQLRLQKPGKNSLSTIIGSYKSAVTKECRERSLEFSWQPRFHDRIIRDEKEFSMLEKYIDTNIERWNARYNQ